MDTRIVYWPNSSEVLCLNPAKIESFIEKVPVWICSMFYDKNYWKPTDIRKWKKGEIEKSLANLRSNPFLVIKEDTLVCVSEMSSNWSLVTNYCLSTTISLFLHSILYSLKRFSFTFGIEKNCKRWNRSLYMYCIL